MGVKVVNPCLEFNRAIQLELTEVSDVKFSCLKIIVQDNDIII